jgi:23S rRNA (adenine2503-C2)-methyltransferase
MSAKTNIIGLSREELAAKIKDIGLEAFRAKQVWQWVYVKGVTDFTQMTSIAKPQQQKLAEHFVIGRPKIVKDLNSFDNTRKWLLEFEDGNRVETVFIPEEDRGALCVSSQVGCTLSCTFCHTGTMKLVRNLTAADIVGQVMVARDGLNEWKKTREDCLFTNIVMMGMGEPLYNYDQVAKALKIVMDSEGISISKRKITLSTSGVVPMIERCGKELNVNLAISLHATRDDLRDEIVPLNKKYPIKELLDACRNYPGASNARRITFEYVMLKGVNDTDADARELVRLLKGIPAKVNLIPFNPWPGSPYECSSNNRIHAFAKIVNDAGYSSPVRKTRGQDIYAACGQLKSDSERKKGQKVWLGEGPQP